MLLGMEAVMNIGTENSRWRDHAARAATYGEATTVNLKQLKEYARRGYSISTFLMAMQANAANAWRHAQHVGLCSKLGDGGCGVGVEEGGG